MAKIVDYTNNTDSQLTIGSYTIPARGEIVFNDGIGDVLLDAQVGFALSKRVDGVESPDPSIAKWKDSTGSALVKPDGTEVSPGGGGGEVSLAKLRETMTMTYNCVSRQASLSQALGPVVIGTQVPSQAIGTLWEAGQLRFVYTGPDQGAVTEVQADGTCLEKFNPSSVTDASWVCRITTGAVATANFFTKINGVRTQLPLSFGTVGIWGADSSGNPAALSAILGTLSTLTTPDKTSVVAAINAAANTGFTPKCPTATMVGTGEFAFTACLPSGYSLQPYGTWDLGTPTGRWASVMNGKSSVSLTQLDFPDLEGLLGAWNLSSTTASLTTINFPKLKIFGASTNISYAALTTCTFPELVVIADNFSFGPASGGLGYTMTMPKLEVIRGLAAFTVQHVNLPELRYAPAQTVLTNYGGAGATASMPKLELMDTLGMLADMATVSLPALKTITRLLGGGSMNTNTTTLSLPALEIVGSFVNAAGAVIQITGTGITSLSFPNLKQVGRQSQLSSVTITSPIDQASVDAILVKLASLDGTNGYEAFNTRTVLLNGASTAAPSATGLAAKATLVTRGCTVTHN